MDAHCVNSLSAGPGTGEQVMLWPMTALYLIRDGRILLLHRGGCGVAAGKWIGSAGGHMEPQELTDPAACVLREMREELGLPADVLDGLRLRYVTLRRAGEELRQNFYFFAHLRRETDLASNEGELRWFAPEDLPWQLMPVSARCMLEHYLHTGRFDDVLYAGVSDGRTMQFTRMEG